MHPLITVAELAGRIGAPGLHVLDASWHLPDTDRDASAEFLADHIPGARFLDVATLIDPARPGLAMAPDAAVLATRLSALGIGAGDEIILYDDSAVHSAARAWWLLRLHGLLSRVLDGGLAAWRAAGHALASGAPEPPSAPSRPVQLVTDPALVRDKAAMLANLASCAAQVVDARGPGRFTGTEAEPRAGIAAGHIPGSVNLHYARLFDEAGRFKRGDALQAAFDAASVDLARPLITTCGSGVTAAVVTLAATLLGKQDVALYDGSWSEWGADPDTPKATGPA